MIRIGMQAAAAAVGIFVATAAYADTSTGTITNIDTDKRTVTLSDDKIYTLTPTTDLTRLKVGYVIRVTYATSGADNLVSAVVLISPSTPGGY